jgi:hypothetical protein
MSISLHVIPSRDEIPEAGELAAETRAGLVTWNDDPIISRIWRDAGVASAEVLVELLDDSAGWANTTRHAAPDLKLSMEGFGYGWISVDGYKAGFDFYFDRPDDFWEKYVREDIAPRGRNHGLTDYPWEQAARLHTWYMRGQAGRSRADWLLAGMAAVALADLTDGLLWSDDGGADYRFLPARPEGFMAWFPQWIVNEHSPAHSPHDPDSV